jgi:hypothetical protein
MIPIIIAVGVIVGAAILKEKEAKQRQKALVPIKVKSKDQK